MSTAHHQPDLLRAFTLFQQHCEQLEESHVALKEQLRSAERELQQRHEELRQRVRQIELMRDRLDAILETIDDAVFLIDQAGQIDTANSAGRDLLATIEPEDSLLDTAPLDQWLAAPEPVKDGELALTVRAGRRHYLASVLPVRQRRARVQGRVVLLKDITVYRQLEQRLAREDRLSALGRVAASVAHEVRNPLGAIEGFARLLQSDLKEQPRSADLADKIVRAARQLNTVVSNLLSYTRDMSVKQEPVELGMLLRELASFYAATATDLRIQLSVQLPEEPLTVAGDTGQLRQALTNLLINAMDACPIRGNGQVCLTAARQGNEIQLRVIDNGCGMSEEVAAHIFEPFFTCKDGGIGLGLALSQRIVEMHHGSLSVTSREHHGTTMTCAFPLPGVHP